MVVIPIALCNWYSYFLHQLLTGQRLFVWRAAQKVQKGSKPFQAPCVCPVIGLGSPPDQIGSLFRGQQLDSQQQRRHTWALAAAGHESPRQNPFLTWGSLPSCPGARLQSMVLLKASTAEAVPEALLSGISPLTTPCTSLHLYLPNKLTTQLLQCPREAASISNTLLPHLSSTQCQTTEMHGANSREVWFPGVSLEVSYSFCLAGTFPKWFRKSEHWGILRQLKDWWFSRNIPFSVWKQKLAP